MSDLKDKEIEKEVLEENSSLQESGNDEVKKKSFISRIREKRQKEKEEKIKEIEEININEASDEKVQEKLKEADQEVKDAGSKKKKITNIIFFIFNICLVVGLLLWNLLGSDENLTPLRLVNINGWAVLIYLMLVVLLVSVDVIGVHRMIYRKTYRSRWALSYKSTVTLRYYDAVTPLASGGQAFMATYLRNRDVPGSTALSIPMAKLVFQQICWVIVCTVCLIIASVQGISGSFVSATSIIGYILAVGMICIILFLSLFKKFGQKIVAWILKLLYKMHLIRDYEKKYNSVMAFVADYQDIMREYSKAKWDVVFQLILHALKYVITYSIPFIIYCIFKGFPTVGWFEMYSHYFVYAALIELSSSFIPLPGGTGMNEITFSVLFSEALGGELFWAMLLWRFATYYLALLQGICIITYDTFYGNKKYRWIKKKLALQEESQVFRKQQIDNFRAERNKRRKREKTLKLTNK